MIMCVIIIVIILKSNDRVKTINSIFTQPTYTCIMLDLSGKAISIIIILL